MLNGFLKNEDKAKDISLKNWFQFTRHFIEVLEEMIGPITDIYSLVMAFAYLSKSRKDLDAELWMKKYLHGTNSFCVLVQQKYGASLTPAVVTFILVVVIFHDRNRFLLESVKKTHPFTSNYYGNVDKDYLTSYIFNNIEVQLNETLKKLCKNVDILEKREFETETYKFEISTGRNPELELSEGHQTKSWKDVKNPATNDVFKLNIKELDESYKKVMQHVCEKFLQNNKKKTTNEQSELNGRVIVMTERNENNEIAQNASAEKDSNEPESFKIRKKHRNEVEFCRRNPLAYNRLKSRVGTETNNNSESKTNNVYLISGNIPHKNALYNNLVYKNREARMKVSNTTSTAVNSKTNYQNKFVKIPVCVLSEEEIKTKLTNLRRTSLQGKEHQSGDEEEGCDFSYQEDKIPQSENIDPDIPTLEELEERVKWLLDDGTRVNPWLIELEERFKNLF